MIHDNKCIGFFLFLSVVIAISISLSIPQVQISIENYWNQNAYKINGADLKIETKYPLKEFDEKIEDLKKDTKIEKSKVYNATIKNGGKEVYGDLIVGDYSTKKNEAILSKNLAVSLNATEGSYISLGDKKYKIVEIEQMPTGVGKQAEEMGYIKVSSFENSMQKPYSELLFINSNNYKNIKEDLKKIATDYSYDTVSDVKKTLLERNSTNMLALNVLNTISIIMTVISILSSIILIVSKYRRDIATMQLLSISSKRIRKVFQHQFKIVLYLAVIVGAFISIIMSRIIVCNNNINYNLTRQIVFKLLIGILFFIIAYSVYIYISCTVICKIKPMKIIRGENQKIIYKGLILKAIIFTLIVLLMYSVYVGGDNIFAGSILVLCMITIFLGIIFILLKFMKAFAWTGKIYKYTVYSIQEQIHSTMIIILSMSFTILFFLIGFTLSNIVSTSYGKELKSNINYNYMLSTDDEEKIDKVLKQTNSTGTYTKLNMKSGIFYLNSKPKEEIMLCTIGKDKYNVKYNIVKGEDIFEGDLEKIVISDEFAKKQKININDTISVRCGELQLQYTVKGIYKSGGMNVNHVLLADTETSIKGYETMYLAKIVKSDVTKKLDGVHIVTLNNIANALEEELNKVLGIFKSMCGICIVLSVVFNINLVYLDLLEQKKNFTIMRGLAMSKKQLIKHLLIKMLIILGFTLLLSVGNYCTIIYYAMHFMFNASNTITIEMILIPAGVAILMIGLIFVIPLITIRNFNNYDELRAE